MSLARAGLVTTATVTWLLLVTSQRHGGDNPYLGLLTAIILPALFFVGLILIPIGVRAGRKRWAGEIQLTRGDAIRRIAIFIGVTTATNVVLAATFTYRAVEHMDSVAFCATSCHVMRPEAFSHQEGAHSRTSCVECHVSPGVSGWLSAKMAGTRQIWQMATNSYPRPVPSSLERNDLVPVRENCEQCHYRAKAVGGLLRVITKYADDQANTRTYSVLLLHIGAGSGPGIHGAHVDPNIEISYRTGDTQRQTIHTVTWRNKRTGETRVYEGEPAKGKTAEFTMQCMDCHNRTAHAFRTPDRVLDRALASGELPMSFPFLKKEGRALLQAEYPNKATAEAAFRTAIDRTYSDQPAAARRHVADSLTAIWDRSVHPEMKVSWGTYPDNIGHTDSPGCFRCHDGSHSTKDGRVIQQDCALCHQVIAVDEPAPEILNTLEVTNTLISRR